jgi:hypothetical protein
VAADWFIADLIPVPNLTRKRGGQGGAARRPHSWDGRDKPGHDQAGADTRFYPYVCGVSGETRSLNQVYWVFGAAPGVSS